MKRPRLDSSLVRLFCRIVLLFGLVFPEASCTKLTGVNAPTPQPTPTSTASTANPTPTRAPTAFGYPEDADQIAEFFDYFSDRAIGVSDVVVRLKLTGTPRASEKPDGNRVTYLEQNSLIKEVWIDSDRNGLVEVHLIYSHPIKVDFDQLKDRIAPHYSGPPPGAVGYLSGQPSAAANMGPPPITVTGTPSGGRQIYTFTASARVYIGSVTVTAEDDGSGTQSGTKNVWELRFRR